MNTSTNFAAMVRQSVIAVPPLARNDAGTICPTENERLMRHIEAGGVNMLLYGGNAVFYHIRLSEFQTALKMLTDKAGPETAVVPSVGPTYGLMMDHAEVLKDFDFPTVMILPQRDITSPMGIVRGIRDFVAAYQKPVVVYLKFENWLPTEAVKALFDEGAISWIKYAVVRQDPSEDNELRRLVDAVPPERIVSGIGEQPAIIHLRDFGVGGFTSGCVCVAPKRSMQMMRAIHAQQWDEAESLRSKFEPLEDLRNEINPIRVLHAAVDAAGIAKTGPIQPLLSGLTTEELTRVSQAAKQLLAWEKGK